MNRRSFLKLLGVAIAAPFVAKAKIALPQDKTDGIRYDEDGWEINQEWLDFEDEQDEELTHQSSIAFSDDNGYTWTQAEIFPDGMVGWAMNEANPGETVTVFMGGSGDLYNFRASIPVTKGNVVTLETIGMKGADIG